MKTTLEIQNLKCGGCANTVTTKLASVAGIENVSVAVEANEVTFNYKTEENLLAAKQKLKSLGYPAADSTNSVVSKAKSLISCATGKMTNHDS
ncbi:heavy-metal-associated domain-containing protein [Bizionia myxarmorum]|uniref:Heavy-metal-associated domain-containing protein n=1 Tax=Bizionia myxarmorum TaxID=291186 RepID=A0A5D0RCA5_9FLAO|nr:heavy metal-associated domain-containing protein [Bizionia myxarmorum]TYB79152.1 heavy-metal-associated domain-containing protein [Bizionia myxarmorum]